MWKFVSLEHIHNVLDDYPSSNNNKIKNAINDEFIYDESDIRSNYTVIRIILILVWCTILIYLQAHYNIFWVSK